MNVRLIRVELNPDNKDGFFFRICKKRKNTISSLIKSKLHPLKKTKVTATLIGDKLLLIPLCKVDELHNDTTLSKYFDKLFHSKLKSKSQASVDKFNDLLESGSHSVNDEFINMEVSFKKDKIVYYDEIKIGEYFWFNGGIYFKFKHGTSASARNIVTNQLFSSVVNYRKQRYRCIRLEMEKDTPIYY